MKLASTFIVEPNESFAREFCSRFVQFHMACVELDKHVCLCLLENKWTLLAIEFNGNACLFCCLVCFRICAATTRRVRHDRTAAGSSGGAGAGPTVAERSSKRKQSTSTGRRHHSVRRGSQYHEVHIAMLPDLSGKRHRLWPKIAFQ